MCSTVQQVQSSRWPPKRYLFGAGDHTCPELQLQFHVSSPVILCVPIEMWNPSYIFRDKWPLSAWNTANLDIWGSLVVVRLVWVCVCVPFLFTHMQKTWRGSLFLLFLNFNSFYHVAVKMLLLLSDVICCILLCWTAFDYSKKNNPGDFSEL